jgi:hypothetical protein
MIGVSLDDITSKNLSDLIDNQVAEDMTLEYKSQLPGASDAEKLEFLADVSSFANTIGGDILYGIEESPSGVAGNIPGLACPNFDEVRQRLESILRDGIKPRLPDCQLRAVDVDGGRKVVVVRVGRSWLGPHRVSFRDHGHFYGRAASGKYRLDVSQLRIAFTLSESIADRVKAFHADRIIRVKADDLPVPLDHGPKVLLHVLPLSAFAFDAAGKDIDLERLRLPPIGYVRFPGSGVSDWRLNLEGCVSFEGRYEPYRAYTQVYRSGIIEAVKPLHAEVREDVFRISSVYETEVRRAVLDYVPFLLKLEFGLPIFIFVCLTGVRGGSLVRPDTLSQSHNRFDRDDVCPAAGLWDDQTTSADIVLRPLLDRLWNAVGEKGSPAYDASGEWRGYP